VGAAEVFESGQERNTLRRKGRSYGKGSVGRGVKSEKLLSGQKNGLTRKKSEGLRGTSRDSDGQEGGDYRIEQKRKNCRKKKWGRNTIGGY